MSGGSPGAVSSRERFRMRLAAALPPERRSALAWQVRPWLYRGTRFECPSCGGRFRAFMTHRGAPNVRCPRCGAMERHRLLSLYLEANPGLLEGSLDVLHVAPEPSLRRRLRQMDNLRYLSGDLCSPEADLAFDLQAMPFADSSFDVVLCNHVLEHVDDDRRAMREIHRVLRPGGWALLMCPIGRDRELTLEDAAARTPAQRLSRFGQEDHVRLYGDDYFERLREAGFAVQRVSLEEAARGGKIERHKLRRDADLFRDDELVLCRIAGFG